MSFEIGEGKSRLTFEIWSKNQKGRDDVRDVDIDWSVILKRVLREFLKK